MKVSKNMKMTSKLVMAALLLVAGCSRGKIERVEWPVMGTIAAVQTRGHQFMMPSTVAVN